MLVVAGCGEGLELERSSMDIQIVFWRASTMENLNYEFYIALPPCIKYCILESEFHGMTSRRTALFRMEMSH